MSGTTVVANRVCPVCGAAVEADVPPLNAADARRGLAVRVCSPACAEAVLAEPVRYVEAALAGRTADRPEDRPLPTDD